MRPGDEDRGDLQAANRKAGVTAPVRYLADPGCGSTARPVQFSAAPNATYFRHAFITAALDAWVRQIRVEMPRWTGPASCRAADPAWLEQQAAGARGDRVLPPARRRQAARIAGVRGATPNVTPVLVTKASSKIPDTYAAEARPWASRT